MYLVSVEGGDGPSRATAAEMIAASLRAAGRSAAPLIYRDKCEERTGCGPPMAVREPAGWTVSHPCETSISRVAATLGAEWIVAAPDRPLGAPVIALDRPNACDPRSVACWESGPDESELPILGPETSPSETVKVLSSRIFPMLPQKSSKDCGRCGMDCVRMAGRIVQGSAKAEDCLVRSSRKVRVSLNGSPLDLSAFPARMLERTLRGMLSSLKGYLPGSAVRIELD